MRSSAWIAAVLCTGVVLAGCGSSAPTRAQRAHAAAVDRAIEARRLRAARANLTAQRQLHRRLEAELALLRRRPAP
jgi:hypothetical protein